MKTTQVATLFCCLFLIGSAEVVAGPMMGAMSADLGVRSLCLLTNNGLDRRANALHHRVCVLLVHRGEARA